MNRSSDHKDLQKVFSPWSAGNRSIDCLEAYKDVVSGPAYKDFSTRHLKGSSKEKVQPVLDKLAEYLFDFIHEEKKYTEKEFDKWHEDICDKFLAKFNKKTSSQAEIKFGKAQKIVNMSFKYLFCFDDSQKYANKFYHCHMPLDKYTLEWFCDKIVPKYNKDKESGDKIKKGEIKKPWSNLEYGGEDDVYSYAWIQKQIREYLSDKDYNKDYIDGDNNLLKPFTAELYIWPEQQFKAKFKSIKTQIQKFNKPYPDYSDSEFNQLCKEICDTAASLSQKFK